MKVKSLFTNSIVSDKIRYYGTGTNENSFDNRNVNGKSMVLESVFVETNEESNYESVESFSFNEITLPEPVDGVFYLVPQWVAQANINRNDLVFPVNMYDAAIDCWECDGLGKIMQ